MRIVNWTGNIQRETKMERFYIVTNRAKDKKWYYTDKVRDYLLDYFLKDERIRLFGAPRGTYDEKIPLFSFVVNGVHHEDLALILDKMGIAVRSGQMCAEPVMDRFGVTGMLRVSLAPYNTMEEAEYFVKCLNRAIDMLM